MEGKTRAETRINSEGTLKVAKKPYASPQLTEYGTVEKLTRSGGSTRAEGLQAAMRMRCL